VKLVGCVAGAGARRTVDGGAAAAVPDPMVTLLQWLPGAFSSALVRGAVLLYGFGSILTRGKNGTLWLWFI